MGQYKSIQSFTIFQSLQPLELLLVASLAKPAQFNKDELVITPQQTNPQLILICQGSVALGLDSDLRKPMTTLGSGDMMGELALLGSSSRLLYAKVTSAQLDTLVISQAAWQQLMLSKPAIANKIMHLIMQRLHKHLSALHFTDVPAAR